MNRIIRLAAAIVLMTLTGCTSSVSGIRVSATQTKMPAPLPPTCPLQIVTVDSEQTMPGEDFGAGGKYQMVGAVAVAAPAGTDPMSPELGDAVRPEACRLGGVVVSLVANRTDESRGRRSLVTTTQQSLVFSVWGLRASSPATPAAF